jgi:hypothetical protein
MTDAALTRRIELTGWSTVLLGGVCIVLAAVQAVTPFLLQHLAEALDAADDPTRSMREAWSAGAGAGALVNGVFGIALIGIGFGVARRRRWAHPALELSCWASIVVLAVLAKPTLAPMFALAGDDASGGPVMMAVSIALLLAQVAAVLWFLRFWRRDEVRAAFR